MPGENETTTTGSDVAVVEEQEPDEEAPRGDRGSDRAAGPADPEARAGSAEELKIVVTVKAGRAVVGVQQPTSDPHIETFDETDLAVLAQEVPAVTERARERWEDSPKHPTNERPAPPARGLSRPCERVRIDRFASMYVVLFLISVIRSLGQLTSANRSSWHSASIDCPCAGSAQSSRIPKLQVALPGIDHYIGWNVLDLFCLSVSGVVKVPTQLQIEQKSGDAPKNLESRRAAPGVTPPSCARPRRRAEKALGSPSPSRAASCRRDSGNLSPASRLVVWTPGRRGCEPCLISRFVER